MSEYSGVPAFVAQRIEHLTTDQKVGGSSPSKRTIGGPKSSYLLAAIANSDYLIFSRSELG
jgi:hypothetical protein